MTSTATIPTATGRRYLQQLCHDWANQFPSECAPEHGCIRLPLGACLLEADDAGLRIRLEPNPDADLARFERVVAEHLLRFAAREQQEINWVRADASV